MFHHNSGAKINGQVANTVFQVTSEPPTVAVALNKENLTHKFVAESRAITLSILGQDAPLSLIGNFGFKSGRDVDKFAKVKYRIGSNGAPIVLEHTIGYLEARVLQQLDVGSHTIFVGELEEADIIEEGEPMTYAYYHQVKRGTTPRTAPTFFKEEKKRGGPSKYTCTVF